MMKSTSPAISSQAALLVAGCQIDTETLIRMRCLGQYSTHLEDSLLAYISSAYTWKYCVGWCQQFYRSQSVLHVICTDTHFFIKSTWAGGVWSADDCSWLPSCPSSLWSNNANVVVVVERMESSSDGTGFSQMIHQNILPLSANDRELNQCWFWRHQKFCLLRLFFPLAELHCCWRFCVSCFGKHISMQGYKNIYNYVKI